MPLSIITVYNSPLDYPGKYVAREFILASATVIASNIIAVEDTYEELLKHKPPDRYIMSRFEGDEPHIVEVWM